MGFGCRGVSRMVEIMIIEAWVWFVLHPLMTIPYGPVWLALVVGLAMTMAVYTCEEGTYDAN